MLQSVEKSIVKLQVLRYQFSTVRPWFHADFMSSHSSGFAVETSVGKFIITNFHCIVNYKEIMVSNFENKTFSGTVVSHFASLDLAMISVPAEFWKTAKCLKFAVPSKGAAVYILGYPALQTSIMSISEGTLNRIAQVRYMQRSLVSLAYEIDCKVNPGNSGGAAVNSAGELCGVPFAGTVAHEIERINWVIPSFLVKMFIEKSEIAIKSRKPIKYFYKQKPSMRMEYLKYTNVDKISIIKINAQELDDEDMINVFGNKGIVVSSIGNDVKGLQLYDVITSIGGTPITNTGHCDFKRVVKKYLNVDHNDDIKTIDNISIFSLIGLLPVNSEVEMEILRKGKPKTIKTITQEYYSGLYEYYHDLPPCYFILHKLLLVPISQMMIKESELHHHLQHSFSRISSFMHSPPGKQNIVIMQTLDNTLNSQYKGIVMQVIDSVNNVIVNNLSHLYEIVNKPAKNYLLKFKNCKDIRIVPGNWKKTSMQTIRIHNIPQIYVPSMLPSFPKTKKVSKESDSEIEISESD